MAGALPWRLRWLASSGSNTCAMARDGLACRRARRLTACLPMLPQAEFGHTEQEALLARPTLLALLDAAAAGTPQRLYLDGWAGSGKSTALFSLVAWARAAGWVVLYLPNADLLVQGAWSQWFCNVIAPVLHAPWTLLLLHWAGLALPTAPPAAALPAPLHQQRLVVVSS